MLLPAVRPRLRRLVHAALFLASVTACRKEVTEVYGIELRGPADVFAEATTAILDVSGREVARAPVRPGMGIDLTLDELNPLTSKTASFRVRGLNAAGELVAVGETPPIEILRVSPILRIWVQRPGTLARVQTTELPVKDHITVTAESFPSNFPEQQTQRPLVVVFGTGRTRLPVNGEIMEALSDELFAYNPYTHFADLVGTTALPSSPRQFRAEAAALARSNNTGQVLIFGGLSTTGSTVPQKVTSELNVFRIRREALLELFKEDLAAFSSQDPLAARASTVLAAPGPVFAFGGRDDNGTPLDTVVSIDIVDGSTNPMKVIEQRMMAPRLGHTATTVSGEASPEVLIFGGGPDGKPIAEVFRPAPAPAQFLAPMGDPGPNRKAHQAVVLASAGNDTRVIVLGGLGSDGQPRADSLLYDARTRTLSPGPITLRTPRHSFTAFVANDDLVVVGGRGADGMPIGNAEIYSVSRLEFVREVPADARARAQAALMGTGAVALIGGEGAGGLAVATVELYQPRQ